MTRLSKCADPDLDVVFVHGLGSDHAAWVTEETKLDWPKELATSENLGVLSIPHHAPMFNVRDTRAVAAQFQTTASGFLDDLKSDGVGIRPIVFVTHSLGGIIVKQALREAAHPKNPHHSIFNKTRCVIFLSTPHAGAAIANAASYLSHAVRLLGTSVSKLFPTIAFIVWPVIWLFARRVRISALTSQLKEKDPALLDLNYWYRSLPNIETRAFYETELTYQCVHVVDQLSADPGVSHCIPRRADFKDHITICKPKDEKDRLFVAVADIIEGVRARVCAGKKQPIFRKGIWEIMTNTTFASYRDAGNFADIPASDDVRREIERLLREGFRQRFDSGESIEASQEQAARDSKYDIDKFVLSLWLEKKLSKQLETLSDYISQAEGAVRLAKEGSKPTLILLYRAARTLEHVLLEFDYGKLETSLERACDTVKSRHSKDFDADSATQKRLEKLASVARGFDDVKRRTRKPPT